MPSSLSETVGNKTVMKKIASLYLLWIQVGAWQHWVWHCPCSQADSSRKISAAVPPSHSWKPPCCLPERSSGARVIFLLLEKKCQAASSSLHLHLRQKATQAANARCLQGTTPGSAMEILSALEMRQPSYTGMQILNQHRCLSSVLYLHKGGSYSISPAVWSLSEKSVQRKKTFPKLNLLYFSDSG